MLPGISEKQRGASEYKAEDGRYLTDLSKEDDELSCIFKSQFCNSQNPGDIL